ncbi:MAG: hypothetical protein HY323_09360 [Betaproteobacteria bacterium]|nr:hypothetical protein [Betaproteobacteria bacterium]
MIKILNPVATPRTEREQRLPCVPGLQGLRIGILSNRWKSMDRMAQRFTQRAKETYFVSAVRMYDIPINGPMTEAVEQRVIDDCDVALVGLAN